MLVDEELDVVEVLGSVEVTGQVVFRIGAGVVDEVPGTVAEGAMPPVPVLDCDWLPVIAGVLLPPDVVGADVCARAKAAVKHTTQARISAGFFITSLLCDFPNTMASHSTMDATKRKLLLLRVAPDLLLSDAACTHLNSCNEVPCAQNRCEIPRCSASHTL